MTRLLRTQNVVDIEDVIAVFIVIAIILDAFAWLREYSAGVPRGLVFEGRVAYPVCRGQMRGQCLQRLEENKISNILLEFFRGRDSRL